MPTIPAVSPAPALPPAGAGLQFSRGPADDEAEDEADAVEASLHRSWAGGVEELPEGVVVATVPDRGSQVAKRLNRHLRREARPAARLRADVIAEAPLTVHEPVG